MKKRFLTFAIVVSSFNLPSFGQKNDSLFSRLQAISNRGTDFFNVDGIEITSQSVASEFSKKTILKKLKKYPIKEDDLNGTDSSLQSQNYYISKSEEISPGTVIRTSYYFIKNKSKGITAITFATVNKINRDFEREFITLVTNNRIPKSVYTPLAIDSINFAGRKIALGKSCNWMGVNNVQCPYYGQINWSVHKTLGDASQSMTNQYNIIKVKKGGKIVSEDFIDVFFEGTNVKAKKVIYDFKGVTSLLAGMSGGKTLTVYFVSSPAKHNFVSCVMSFWNNDNINPSGLPPLLEQVMQFRK